MSDSKRKIRYTDDGLIVAGLSSRSRWLFLLYWLLLVGSLALLVFFFDFSTMLVCFIPVHFFLDWGRLKFPANFRPVSVRKDKDFVYVNHKALPLAELLFLSVHETENYAVIRLEARRKSMLFPKEAKLLGNCSGFEEALQLCREIRDFIDPGLKINHVMLVSGKSRNTGVWGSRSIKFEHWEFIE